MFVRITVIPVVLIQCYRTWVGKVLRHIGRPPIWQGFFRFRQEMYGYLSQTTYTRYNVPTWTEVVHSTHSSSSVTHLPLTRRSSLFFLPAQNALSPVSICANSVVMFHSSILCWQIFFFLIFHITCHFICICIGNSMISSDIWHKYLKWYFKIVIGNFMSL